MSLFYLCMSLFLGACTNDDIIEENESDVAISFSPETPSRAVVNTMDDMKSGSFSVWAWHKPINGIELREFYIPRVYFNVSVWTYNNTKYWSKNNTYNFYALYPDTITNANYNENGKLNIPRLDIRQTDEYNNAKVVDLMKATQNVDVGMNPPQTVNLTFSHMLTNVNIDLKMHQANGEAGDLMEVTYVLLNGMNCVGSMQNDVWNLSEPSYFWDRLDTPLRLRTFEQPCFSNVLMLPQSIAKNQVMLYVLYSYQQEGGEPMTKLLETYLPEGEWKAGEKIIYSGTIQVDNSIVFDTPQVESWGTEQVGGTIIIQ